MSNLKDYLRTVLESATAAIDEADRPAISFSVQDLDALCEFIDEAKDVCEEERHYRVFLSGAGRGGVYSSDRKRSFIGWEDLSELREILDHYHGGRLLLPSQTLEVRDMAQRPMDFDSIPSSPGEYPEAE